jgi:hypothetical protein
MLSSDDPVMPNWLEESVRFLDRHHEILVSYPDWRIIDESGCIIQSMPTHEYSLTAMVSWFVTLPGPGAIVRKSALPGLADIRDPSYRYAPDLESWMRLGLLGQFARIPIELATWRRHPASITIADRSRARAREMVRIAQKFFARPDLPPEIRSLKTYTLSRAYWIASWVVADSAPLRSALYLRRSYSLAPDDPPGLPVPLRRYFPPPDLKEIWRIARKSLWRQQSRSAGG